MISWSKLVLLHRWDPWPVLLGWFLVWRRYDTCFSVGPHFFYQIWFLQQLFVTLYDYPFMHMQIGYSCTSSRSREELEDNGSNDWSNDSWSLLLFTDIISLWYLLLTFLPYKLIKLWLCWFSSFTAEERENPELLAESPVRRKRIAQESGKTEQQVWGGATWFKTIISVIFSVLQGTIQIIYDICDINFRWANLLLNSSKCGFAWRIWWVQWKADLCPHWAIWRRHSKPTKRLFIFLPFFS